MNGFPMSAALDLRELAWSRIPATYAGKARDPDGAAVYRAEYMAYAMHVFPVALTLREARRLVRKVERTKLWAGWVANDPWGRAFRFTEAESMFSGPVSVHINPKLGSPSATFATALLFRREPIHVSQVLHELAHVPRWGQGPDHGPAFRARYVELVRRYYPVGYRALAREFDAITAPAAAA